MQRDETQDIAVTRDCAADSRLVVFRRLRRHLIGSRSVLLNNHRQRVTDLVGLRIREHRLDLRR